MAQKIKKLSKKLITFVCMITLVFSISIVNNADATLASVSDTLSDSRFNTATNHVIVFTVKAGDLTNPDTIIVGFEADFDTASVVFSDISVNGSVFGAFGLDDGACVGDGIGVTGEGTDTVTFTVCSGTTITDEEVVTITFANSHITNPAAATCGSGNNSYVCDIDITTSDESGTAQVAIVSGVTVSATVNEALTFVISDVAVGFGGINPGTLRYANSLETGATAAPGAGDPFSLTYTSNVAGASITVKSLNGAGTAGLYSPSVTQTLTAKSATTMSGATNGFAVYGTSSDMTMDAGFNGAGGNVAVTTGNLPFASASAVGQNVVEVDLIASAAVGTLGASDYATTLVFVATPVY
jgi:hypothetical protein